MVALLFTWVLQMPKDKGKCQAQSMAHNLLFPHPIQLVSYRTHRIIFFPNRNMKICARKSMERGVGTFPEWGFRLCIIFYSWKFVNDRFRLDLFRTKRHIYLGRKQRHSGKGMCSINLILILKSRPKIKETVT